MPSGGSTAGAIRAGRAFVEIFADATNLQKGLKAAQSHVQAMGSAISSVGAKLGAAGGAITVPFMLAAKQFAEAGSELLNMSIRTGVSIKSLSTLTYVAKQTGLDIGTVELAMRKMARAITAGSLESMQAEKTFAKLGLSINDLLNMKPEDQFAMISKRIAEIPNPTARAGAAMMIFGRSGTMLLPLIEDLNKLTQEAKDFGLVATREGAESAHKLERSFNLLGITLKKITGVIGATLAPELIEWNRAMARCAKTAKDFIAAHKDIIQTAFKVAVGMTAAGTAIGLLGASFIALGSVLGTVASGLGLVGKVLGTIVTLPELIVVSLGAMGVYFASRSKIAVKSIDQIRDAFSTLGKDAQSALGGLSNAIKAGNIELAMKILVASIKVEWAKLTVSMSDQWTEFTNLFQNTFAIASTNIAKRWISTVDSIKIELDTLAVKAKKFLEQEWAKPLFKLQPGGASDSIKKWFEGGMKGFISPLRTVLESTPPWVQSFTKLVLSKGVVTSTVIGQAPKAGMGESVGRVADVLKPFVSNFGKSLQSLHDMFGRHPQTGETRSPFTKGTDIISNAFDMIIKKGRSIGDTVKSWVTVQRPEGETGTKRGGAFPTEKTIEGRRRNMESKLKALDDMRQEAIDATMKSSGKELEVAKSKLKLLENELAHLIKSANLEEKNMKAKEAGQKLSAAQIKERDRLQQLINRREKFGIEVPSRRESDLAKKIAKEDADEREKQLAQKRVARLAPGMTPEKIRAAQKEEEETGLEEDRKKLKQLRKRREEFGFEYPGRQERNLARKIRQQEKPEAPKATEAENAPEPPEGIDTEDITRALHEATRKSSVDVAGSFSAAALAGLGAGTSVADIQEEQLKEAKRQTAQLEKFSRKLDTKVFVHT